MSRFFKSAAFPILIVVVLAFFAQQLISPSSDTAKPTFADFNAQLAAGQVKNVVMKSRDNEIEVTLDNKTKYKVGFAPDYGDTLTKQLITAKTKGELADFDVKGTRTGVDANYAEVTLGTNWHPTKFLEFRPEIRGH